MSSDNDSDNRSAEEIIERMYARRSNIFWKLRRELKFWWQRRTRGWDDSVTWNMDVAFANYILPRLKYFRDNHMGYPPKLGSDEAWIATLDKMIRSFELVIEYEGILWAKRKELLEFDEGIKLFAEYYLNLWD
jgi:hypothetical protein